MVLLHIYIVGLITSNPHSEANSLSTSPVELLPARRTLPPSSMNCVKMSTFNEPPNSSTEGANMIKLSYMYSPYFDNINDESSAILNVNVNPLSDKQD